MTAVTDSAVFVARALAAEQVAKNKKNKTTKFMRHALASGGITHRASFLAAANAAKAGAIASAEMAENIVVEVKWKNDTTSAETMEKINRAAKAARTHAESATETFAKAEKDLIPQEEDELEKAGVPHDAIISDDTAHYKDGLVHISIHRPRPENASYGFGSGITRAAAIENFRKHRGIPPKP